MKLRNYLFAVLLLLVAPAIASAVSVVEYTFPVGYATPIVYMSFSEPAGDTTANVPLTNKVYSDFEGVYMVNAAAAVAITPATQTMGAAYSSGGIVKVSDTVAAGLYRVDLPVGTCATAGNCTVQLSCNDVQIAICHIKVGDAYDTLTAATTQPAQGAPSATASVATQIGWLYKNWRNKTSYLADGSYRLYNDDGTTVDSKATIRNVQGRGVIERGEVVTGP